MSQLNEQGKFRALFPPEIQVKDFGYSKDHDFRWGQLPLVYDGINVIGADYNSDEDSNSGSDGDDDFSDANMVADEINRKAIALFDFNPENDNEVPLVEGQIIWISYRHGQGWLVAEDPKSGEIGLVPEEYVEIYYDNKEIFQDIPRPFLPQILQKNYDEENEDEWEDTDYYEEENDTKMAPPDMNKLKLHEDEDSKKENETESVENEVEKK